MKAIPFTGGVYLSAEEKVAIAEQIVTGELAKHEIRGFVAAMAKSLETLERTTNLGNALSEGLDVAIGALQNGTDAQVALDQIQAALVSAWQANYPDEPVPGL